LPESCERRETRREVAQGVLRLGRDAAGQGPQCQEELGCARAPQGPRGRRRARSGVVSGWPRRRRVCPSRARGGRWSCGVLSSRRPLLLVSDPRTAKRGVDLGLCVHGCTETSVPTWPATPPSHLTASGRSEPPASSPVRSGSPLYVAPPPATATTASQIEQDLKLAAQIGQTLLNEKASLGQLLAWPCGDQKPKEADAARKAPFPTCCFP
jgi:hypothetical protein